MIAKIASRLICTFILGSIPSSAHFQGVKKLLESDTIYSSTRGFIPRSALLFVGMAAENHFAPKETLMTTCDAISKNGKSTI